MGTETTRMEGVYDESGNPIQDYDLALGYLAEHRKTVRHAAVEGVAEEGHWETVAEYPGGGKDVAWVVDVPGVEARDAWDEIVVFDAFVPYTAEELAEMERLREQPSAEERMDEIEAAMMELASILEGGALAPTKRMQSLDCAAEPSPQCGVAPTGQRLRSTAKVTAATDAMSGAGETTGGDA